MIFRIFSVVFNFDKLFYRSLCSRQIGAIFEMSNLFLLFIEIES
jgi:hypothetical protein